MSSCRCGCGTDVDGLVIVDAGVATDGPAPHSDRQPVHLVTIGRYRQVQRLDGKQPLHRHLDTGLLEYFTYSAGSRLLARLQAAGDQGPVAGVRSTDHEYPVVLVEDHGDHAIQR
jgi:hypothetical protein